MTNWSILYPPQFLGIVTLKFRILHFCWRVWSCRWLPVFRMNVSPTSSGLKWTVFLFQIWRWKRYFPPKHWKSPIRLQGVTIQNTTIDIISAVRTSNLLKLVCWTPALNAEVGFNSKSISVVFVVNKFSLGQDFIDVFHFLPASH